MNIIQLPAKLGIGPKRSVNDINSIVLHTTGWGAGLDRIWSKTSGNLEKSSELYAKRMQSILKYKGHYLIGWDGRIWQFMSLDRISWHTGSGKKNQLKKKDPPEWWKKRWSSIVDNPTKLPSWETGSPNEKSIGIDLLAHGSKLKGYTDAQYESAAWLISRLTFDYDIPIDVTNILGHEDLDWISRNGWDPGKKWDWNKLFDEASKLNSRVSYHPRRNS